jgi:predicted nuclease of predicted toxin-antitoxin system
MKVLIDECVPAPLARLLTGHDCATVQFAGWTGIKNGQLLQKAELAKFDVFITADKNLRDQQQLTGRSLAILELSTNDLRRLRAAAAAIAKALVGIHPGDYRLVEVP